VASKLSSAKERLHLLGESTKVSGSREHFPVSLSKSAIHKIELTTPP